MQVKNSEWAVAEVQLSYTPTHDPCVRITSTTTAERVLREMWDTQLMSVQEQFCVLLLNNHNEVIGFRCINTGSQTGSNVDIKLVMAMCLKSMAAGLIIAHNHPSGMVIPSLEDISLTKRFGLASQFFGIRLVDHMILSSKKDLFIP